MYPSDCVVATARRCIGVRETSRNWSERIAVWLRWAGINYPAPWCAAWISGVLRTCGERRGPKIGRASVSAWVRWAKAQRLHATARVLAKPGDLAYWLNADGTGHIGIVERIGHGFDPVESIEGNTNDAGSREGDAVAPKKRNASEWHGYILMHKLD